MGIVASTIANVNRDPKKRPEPFEPLDFISWAQGREAANEEPIELDDAKEQSDLIRAVMFGIPAAS